MRAPRALLAIVALLAAGGALAADVALKPRYVRPKPQIETMQAGVYPEGVVLKIVQPSEVWLRDGKLVSLDARHDVGPLDDLLSRYPGVKIERMFTRPEEDLDRERLVGEANTKQELGDLNLYYLIDLRGAKEADPKDFVNELNRLDLVELAYPLEKPEPAQVLSKKEFLVSDALAPQAVGNYEAEQGYLDAAPTGIDAEWAWGLTGGRGSNVKFIDIEWDWNLNHADLGVEFVRLPATYAPSAPWCNTDLNPDGCDYGTNHGTAVLGEVVSINNGWGTTGIASSASFGVSNADNGTAWPNVANAINLAAAQLVAGDILLYEMHSHGPASGQACPCNCGQFEYVAMEYWQANFDATAAAVALGIIVVEAAGNGSMDLDNAIYGGLFNRSTRDSGAILVGGGSSATHSPMCWTNYGSRVDLQGWGENVVTLGYGTRYATYSQLCPPDSNCTNSHNWLFANGFAGTSSASPIVVGAAAITEGVSETKYGSVLTPARMRQILAYGATAQGTPADGNIGPLPNLNGVIRADLVRFQPGGWSDSVVARNATGCTGGSCTVTATLTGNSSATYYNISGRNDGIYETTPTEARLYVDDVYSVRGRWGGALVPGGWPVWIDAGPYTVRGGRHTLRVDWDALDETPEWFETNNMDTVQYVWSPYILTTNTPVVRTAPPDRDTTGYSWFNSDGFQFSRGGGSSWWVGVGTLSADASDDYDVRIYDETTTSTAGFGSYLSYSSWGAGVSDFVLMNGNKVGSTATRWAGALQGANTPGTSNATVESSSMGSWYTARGTHSGYSLGTGHVLQVHELYFGSTDIGTSVDFKLDNLGAADLGISLYDAAGSYFAKSEYLAGGYADAYGAGGDETFTVVIPAEGWYGLVVWKVGSADLPASSDYSLTVADTPPDLEPYPAPGWSSPVVVRSANDCNTSTCVDTATLPGNSNMSYFNSMVTNTGPNPSSGTHRRQYYLDDVEWGWMSDPNPVAPGGISWHTNFQSLGIIRGGRHTVRMDEDVYDGVVESDETNNTYARQYVWSPLSLGAGDVLTRSAPPDGDSLGYSYFNCDGFSYATGWWGAVGMIPSSASDNYDVRLHNDYTGSTAGFGSNLKWSNQGAGLSDFVMVNGNRVGNGSTWYAGVIQATTTPATGNFEVHHVNQALTVAPPGTWTYSIPSNGVMFLLEFNFLSGLGKTYGFKLWNDSGGANLGFGLYDGVSSHFRKADAVAQANENGRGGNEKFSITIPDNEWYGLAVWKNGSADLAAASSFRIEVSELLPTEVPGESTSGIQVSRSGPTTLTVGWSQDCNQFASTNYSLYTGDLDDLRAGTWDYAAAAPVCDAGQDLTETVAMPSGNVFFLLVPHNGAVEGSYGFKSDGTQRPAAGGLACHTQNTGGACF